MLRIKVDDTIYHLHREEKSLFDLMELNWTLNLVELNLKVTLV